MHSSTFIRAGVHLPVFNLRETLDYYRDQLGFYDEWIWNNIDGGVRRNELRLLFGENPEHVTVINGTMRRLPLVWFVENIEAIYEEYQQRGLKIVSPLQTHPYAIREFAFIEINGYYVRIAEPVKP